MDSLRVTSCLAANADPAIARIAGWLSQRLGRPVAFDESLAWQERERQLDSGEMHAGWLCGWPYVRKADRSDMAGLQPLAAPIMAAERYQGRPIYFSDVVVKQDSEFNGFDDLRGATFACNEPGSHSGFNIMRHHLWRRGETWDFFGRVVFSGSHAASLAMIRAGQADAAAIDSTMLDTELALDAALAAETRIIAQLGPSPMPPWVAAAGLPAAEREALRDALLSMHTDPAGRAVLAQAGYARFAPAGDADYDAMRAMVREAGHLLPEGADQPPPA